MNGVGGREGKGVGSRVASETTGSIRYRSGFPWFPAAPVSLSLTTPSVILARRARFPTGSDRSERQRNECREETKGTGETVGRG